MEAEIAKMRADFALAERNWVRESHEMKLQEKQIVLNRIAMGKFRKVNGVSAHRNGHA
jgi:hypothetical protein